MNNDVVRQIKEKVSIRDFIESTGAHIDRKGFCCCPFHGEKTASLKIYDKTNSWYCFGCNRGGDVITFAKGYYKVSFQETVKILMDQYGIERGKERDLKSTVYKVVDQINRQRRMRQLEQLENEYWIVYEKWLDSDRKSVDLAPKAIWDDFSKEFSEAVASRDSLLYYLELLDYKRRTLADGE